jgi:hypothetical protein
MGVNGKQLRNILFCNYGTGLDCSHVKKKCKKTGDEI